MASSDVSVATGEAWHADAPATEASLAQGIELLRQQMQMQHQLQVDALKQPYAVPAFWPPQPPFWQMPSPQEPSTRQKKTRAGRLGKRERAQLKASNPRRGEDSEEESRSWTKVDRTEDMAEAFRVRLLALEERCEKLELQLGKAEEKVFELEAKAEMTSMSEAARAGLQARLAERCDELESIFSSEVVKMEMKVTDAATGMEQKLEERSSQQARSLEAKMAAALEQQDQAAARLSALDTELQSMMDSKLDAAMADLQARLADRFVAMEGTFKAELVTVDMKVINAVSNSETNFEKNNLELEDLKTSMTLLHEGCTAAAMAKFRSEWTEKLQQLEAEKAQLEEDLAKVTEAQDEKEQLVKDLAAKVEELEEAVGHAKEAAESEGGETEVSSLNPQEPAPAPASDALEEAIKNKKSEQALELLRLREVPGLNDLVRCNSYCSNVSMVSLAILLELPQVAVALLGRSDFQQVNSADTFRFTCLHEAAYRGASLEVCKAILARKDFLKAQAKANYGQTALDVARRHGNSEMVRLLEAKLH